MQNQDAKEQARVTACKVVLDTLSRSAPHVLKELDATLTLEEASQEVLGPRPVPDAKEAVN
jgi:hypothetical protein